MLPTSCVPVTVREAEGLEAKAGVVLHLILPHSLRCPADTYFTQVAMRQSAKRKRHRRQAMRHLRPSGILARIATKEAHYPHLQVPTRANCGLWALWRPSWSTSCCPPMSRHARQILFVHRLPPSKWSEGRVAMPWWGEFPGGFNVVLTIRLTLGKKNIKIATQAHSQTSWSQQTHQRWEKYAEEVASKYWN